MLLKTNTNLAVELLITKWFRLRLSLYLYVYCINCSRASFLEYGTVNPPRYQISPINLLPCLSLVPDKKPLPWSYRATCSPRLKSLWCSPTEEEVVFLKHNAPYQPRSLARTWYSRRIVFLHACKRRWSKSDTQLPHVFGNRNA